MSEFRDYHYRHRSLSLPSQPIPEIIRNEIEYRGLKLRRGDRNAGYIWNIFDSSGEQIIGGSFTKLPLAEFAVDRYFDQKGSKDDFDANDEEETNH
jgi:hypothetical protein